MTTGVLESERDNQDEALKNDLTHCPEHRNNAARLKRRVVKYLDPSEARALDRNFFRQDLRRNKFTSGLSAHGAEKNILEFLARRLG